MPDYLRRQKRVPKIIKKIGDNRAFWKTIKSNLADKTLKYENSTVDESEKEFLKVLSFLNYLRKTLTVI